MKKVQDGVYVLSTGVWLNARKKVVARTRKGAAFALLMVVDTGARSKIVQSTIKEAGIAWHMVVEGKRKRVKSRDVAS